MPLPMFWTTCPQHPLGTWLSTSFPARKVPLLSLCQGSEVKDNSRWEGARVNPGSDGMLPLCGSSRVPPATVPGLETKPRPEAGFKEA